MASMTLTAYGPITMAERDAIPDDGRRHELIDGMLHVTPAPGMPHQDVLGNLYLLMRAGCPVGVKVVLAPFDVVLAVDTVVEPDLLVADRGAFTRKNLPSAPLLAVEIASPSTRRYDRLLKRDRYEAAGVNSYWLIDSDTPSITVLELRDGAYTEVAHGVGAEVVEVTLPFPVRLAPAELLDD